MCKLTWLALWDGAHPQPRIRDASSCLCPEGARMIPSEGRVQKGIPGQTHCVYQQDCEVCLRVSIVVLRHVQSSLFIWILVCSSEYALTSHMLETIE